MNPRAVSLFDRHSSTPGPVVADVIRDFPPAAVAGAEALWKPERAKLNPPMEHVHWDWALKSGFPFRFVAAICRGRVEGMAALYPGPKENEFRKPETAAYLAFLESAPWNLPEYPNGPHHKGVGSALLTEAILLSHDMGQRGRVLLSALPQAERYYRGRGMTELGLLPSSSLVYFEYTETQAASFLAHRGVTI